MGARHAQGSAPARPSAGPLALAAIGAWAAAVLAEELSWHLYAAGLQAGAQGRAVAVVSLGALAAGLLLGAASVWRLRRGLPAWRVAPLLMACAAVLACGMLSWQVLAQDNALLQRQLEQGPVQLELAGDPSPRASGQVSAALWQGDRRKVSLRVLWPHDAQPPAAGHVVLAGGRLLPLKADDAGRSCHQQGYAGTLVVSQWEERGYATGLRGLVTPLRDASMERIGQLGGDAAGLLGGILLGNKTLYSGTELEQDFRVTGLAHLMAVSGTHLAVVSLIAGWLLGRTKMERGRRSVLLALLLGGYVALTGFAPSALRACAMCAVGLGAAAVGRRRHALSALGACVLIFVALKPQLAFSLGFELSVLCIAGLLLLAPLLGEWMAYVLPARLRGLAQPLAASVAASLATLPATVPLFCQLPLIAALATLLAAPLVTAALGIGVPALLLAAMLEAPGQLLLGLAGAVAAACAALVHRLADIPLACVPLDASAGWVGALFLTAGAALWALWPQPPHPAPGAAVPARTGLRALCAALLPRAGVLGLFCLPALLLMLAELGGVAGCANVFGRVVESDAQVVMLDVGQGDAMLVRDGSFAVLVDTGEEGPVLLAALARQGVSRLDAVLVSHLDKDHCGALGALAGVVEVGAVYLHAELLQREEAAALLEDARRASRRQAQGVLPGARVQLGRFELELLAPVHAAAGDNGDSLVWLLSFDADGDGAPEQRGLLTGDAEAEELAAVAARTGRVSFVKLGHHGSAGCMSAAELAALRPSLALIGVGEGNRYGHPHASTLALMRAAGVRVLRTDTQGDLRLLFSADVLGVATQRGSP